MRQKLQEILVFLCKVSQKVRSKKHKGKNISINITFLKMKLLFYNYTSIQLTLSDYCTDLFYFEII